MFSRMEDTMTIENRIKKVFMESLELEDKTEEIKTIEDLDLKNIEGYGVEINSLLVLEIMMGLESEFEIELNPVNFDISWITDIEKLKELVTDLM